MNRFLYINEDRFIIFGTEGQGQRDRDRGTGPLSQKRLLNAQVTVPNSGINHLSNALAADKGCGQVVFFILFITGNVAKKKSLRKMYYLIGINPLQEIFSIYFCNNWLQCRGWNR